MKVVYIQVPELQKEYTLLIGRNRNENDKLVRESDPTDLWFHLQDVSGPHFVLQTGGDEIPKKYLNMIVGLFREYKTGLPSRYTVIYTEIQNVKPTKVPGTVITSKTRSLRS